MKSTGTAKIRQFYGKNASFNMEARLRKRRILPADIGEAKKTERGYGYFPAVEYSGYLCMTLPPARQRRPQMLGDITGEKAQAGKLADYCRADRRQD